MEKRSIGIWLVGVVLLSILVGCNTSSSPRERTGARGPLEAIAPLEPLPSDPNVGSRKPIRIAALTNLLQNPGFEDGTTGWGGYNGGFAVDSTGGRSGGKAVRLSNNGSGSFGAGQNVNLNQTTAQPIYFCGYSKAQGVSGSPDINYSVYLDIGYTDGTFQWQRTLNFATGSHDWQYLEATFQPAKPIAWVRAYVLLRSPHAGTVWFDDVCLGYNDTNPASPAAPTGFAATAISSSQINLSWNAVTGSTGYVLERRTGSNPYSIVQGNLSTTSYSDSGLAAGTRYDYRLRARHSSGESVNVEANATTLAGTSPPPPTPVGGNLLQNPDLEAAGTGWGSYSSGYTIDATGGRGGSKALRLSRSTTPDYGAGQSVTLNQSTPQPIYFCGYSRAQGVSGSASINYSVYLDIGYTDGTFQWQRTLNFATGSHDWHYLEGTFQPAKPISWVRFYLLLRNPHTGTVWFDDVCLRSTTPGPPPPPTQPATPSGFVATAVLSSQINLSWNTVSGATGYVLERRTGSNSFSPLQSNLVATSYSDSGLSASTRYDYRLRAKNASGESPIVEASATTSSTPPPPPPPPPTGSDPTLDGLYERIKVSANGRYFVTESGKPFFPVGDTNWMLANAATREEVLQYLNDRKAKGFNTILSTATSQIVMTNRYGYFPFEHLVPTASTLQLKGYDFSRPVEGYWTHMDYVINQANQMGFLVQMNMMWANLSGGPFGWRIPVAWTDAKALEYGRFLGRRYGQKRVVWMVGGDDRFDYPCEYTYGCTTGEDRLRWYQLMIQGLKEFAPANTLFTFHPAGGYTSNMVVGNPSWLNFHAHQSGHIAHLFNSKVPGDYGLTPTKPILDIEPLYDDNALWDSNIGNWSRTRPTPHEVRRIQYWNVLSGAAGAVYGHLAVAVMYTSPGNEYLGAPSMTWWQGLSAVPSSQMVHLSRLVVSRPYYQARPDTSFIVGDKGSGITTLTALSAPGFALVYTPIQRSISVDISRFGSTRAWWYNPQNGQASNLGLFSGQVTIPAASFGPDAVLVLDQASQNFATPGQR